MGLPQIKERVSCLSGELKAAREAQGECRTARDNQKRLLDIADQAVERADARVKDLEEERAELAEQARAAILTTGDDVTTEPLNVFNSELYDSMLENAESRVNGAFERATQ